MDQERSSLKLERNFPNAGSLVVSPDSSIGCLYIGHEIASFQKTGSQWIGSDGNSQLQIVDMHSWAVLPTTLFTRKPAAAEFFADSVSLYVQTLPEGSTGHSYIRRLVMNVRTGSREQQIQEYHPGDAASLLSLFPLANAKLAGTILDPNTMLLGAITLVALPDYRVIAKVVIGSADQLHKNTDVIASNDRSRLGYISNQTLYWRCAEDLSLVWQRSTAKEMMPRWVVVSADGHYLAASFIDTYWTEDQRVCYVDVFSTIDGTPVTRIPITGNALIAISPKGKMLAVSQYDWEGAGRADAFPRVELFEIASGRVVGSVVHDRVHVYKNRFFGVPKPAFSPDGRFLITSGLDGTKVWRMALGSG